MGRNGAGKTSLLNVIAGDEPPLAGRAVVRGRLGYLRLMLAAHRGLASPRGWRWPVAFALILSLAGGGVNAA